LGIIFSFSLTFKRLSLNKTMATDVPPKRRTVHGAEAQAFSRLRTIIRRLNWDRAE